MVTIPPLNEMYDIDEEWEGNEPAAILFTVNNHRYELTVRKIDGVYVPEIVFHDFPTFDCPFCGSNPLKLFTCDGLTSFRFDLFQQLIQSNAIRLTWIYQDYRLD